MNIYLPHKTPIPVLMNTYPLLIAYICVGIYILPNPTTNNEKPLYKQLYDKTEFTKTIQTRMVYFFYTAGLDDDGDGLTDCEDDDCKPSMSGAIRRN